MNKKILQSTCLAIVISIGSMLNVKAQGEFITVWDMATPGSSASEIRVGFVMSGNVAYTWETYPVANVTGAGTFFGSGTQTIVLPSFQKVMLKIRPANFQRININGGADKNRLVDILQWGTVAWTGMQNAFMGCSSLTGLSATDAPNLSNVTDMSFMFRDATNFNHNIGNWNVSNVTNMSNMFANASAFNTSVGGWNVSKVTDMSFMFFGANSFNQPIGSWNVTSVTNMSNMFARVNAFNQSIGGWNVSNVTNMSNMFDRSRAFNQPIGGWNVSNVINMESMFNRAVAFNQSLSGWNISKVTNMSFMFNMDSSFNQNLAAWGLKLNPAVTMQNFLNASGMSATNYDALLIGLNAGTVTNVTMGAFGVYFCNAGAARTNLRTSVAMGGKGWDITDSWSPTVTIVTQPRSSTVCGNNFNIFSVSATGQNLSYNWANPMGNVLSTNRTFSTSTTGNYLVTVTSDMCVSSISNTVNLERKSNTSISVQPLVSATVCSGIFQNYEVSATGENLSYIWSDDLGTNNFINTSVAGTYFVTVLGYCGNVISSPANLVVNPLTSIVAQPISTSSCQRAFSTFAVSALGTNLMYAWSNGLSTTTSMITSTVGTNYNVTVSGTCGSAISNTVTLSTLLGTGISAQTPSQSVCGSNFVTFAISPTGSNFRYIWSNGENTNFIYTSVPGIYTATVSGTCGSAVSNPFSLTTLSVTSITTQPLSQIIQPSATANLSVEATGVDLTFKWSSNETVSAISGKGAGVYTVTVFGTCGSVVSEAATIIGLALSNATITGVSANGALTSATSITISGTGFSNTATVTVNGISISNFTISGNSIIVATIPAGTLLALNNIILVQNPNQVASANTPVTINDVTTGVNSPFSILNSQFNIYPNPVTNGEWRIENGELGATMYVFNAQGAIVYAQTITSTTTLVSAKLSSGIYLVKVGTQMVKLVVE